MNHPQNYKELKKGFWTPFKIPERLNSKFQNNDHFPDWKT
jgi:hypothetical protein